MESYYVGYGHRSIGDCGSTTMFIEGVSMLVAKAIQDWPLYSGQETSTRAINFSSSPDPVKVVGKLRNPVGSAAGTDILEAWMAFYEEAQRPTATEVRRRYPRQEGEDEVVYERAVKARVFDILRGFLPAGATTQLSWHTNLRQAGDHLTWLIHHPLKDVRDVAFGLADVLAERYPASGASFGDLALLSGIGTKTEGFFDKERRRMWEAETARQYAYSSLKWHYPMHDTLSGQDLQVYKKLFQTRPKGCVLPHFLSDLGQLWFNFDLDFGSFRDLQRHRNGVCRMPLLTTQLGFEKWYLDQLDNLTALEAEALIVRQTKAIGKLMATENVSAEELQNYIAMGFKVPCNVAYTLPAAVYVMELRSGKTVHPTLRAVIHDMIKRFHNEFPDIPLHVDMDADSWTLRRGQQIIAKKEIT
jgi:hypothetical protein